MLLREVDEVAYLRFAGAHWEPPRAWGSAVKTSKLSTDDLAGTDPLLTKQQVADLYGGTIRFVENLIAEGALPAYKIGAKMVRIRRSDALAVLRPIRTVGDAV